MTQWERDIKAAGLTDLMVLSEVMWLQFIGIDLSKTSDQEKYLFKVSRTGRDFALNRRTRKLIIEYVMRLQRVAVDNVECHLLDQGHTYPLPKAIRD